MQLPKANWEEQLQECWGWVHWELSWEPQAAHLALCRHRDIHRQHLRLSHVNSTSKSSGMTRPVSGLASPCPHAMGLWAAQPPNPTDTEHGARDDTELEVSFNNTNMTASLESQTNNTTQTWQHLSSLGQTTQPARGSMSQVPLQTTHASNKTQSRTWQHLQVYLRTRPTRI